MKIQKYLIKNLVISLVLHEKIQTTQTRAKALQSVIDRLITHAKKDTLHGRRQVGKLITDKKALAKITQDLGMRFTERTSGFTRIIKLAPRNGDVAKMVQIEFVEGINPKAIKEKNTVKEVAKGVQEKGNKHKEKSAGRQKAGTKKESTAKTASRGKVARKAKPKKES